MKKPFVFLWTAFAGIVLFSWVYLPSLSKYHDLKQQQDELDKQIAKFSKDVEAIREERDLLKNDPEYLEKVIRDELGLVKPGEIVYKFVQDKPEENIQNDELPAAEPSSSPSPEGITVEAKPVAPKTAPSVVPRAPIAKPSTAPKKPLPSAGSEPVYPRRETR